MFKNMAMLALGASTARLIGIITIPLLTRIYSPSDFGVLSVYNSLVLLLVPLLTLRYMVAIPLPRTDGMAMNLMLLCFLVKAIMISLITIVLWRFGSIIFPILSMPNLAPYWWLISIGALGAAIYETLTMWATRKKAFKIIAHTQFTQSLIGEILKVTLGLFSLKPMGLLIGQLVGQSAGSSNIIRNFKTSFLALKKQINIRRIIFSSMYYRSFPIYRLPAQIFLVFSMQAPLLIMATIFNANTAGQFGLAQMTLMLPFNLLGQAMSRAYYGEVAELGITRLNQIINLTRIVMIRMAILALPVTIILFFTGEPLFSVVFGKQWESAGAAAGILSLYLIFQFAATAPLQVLNILESQLFYLNIYMIRAGLVAGTFFIANLLKFDFIQLIWLYTIAMILYYIVVLISLFLLLKKANLNAVI